MVKLMCVLRKQISGWNPRLFGVNAAAEMMRYHEISLPLQRMLIAVAELATVEM